MRKSHHHDKRMEAIRKTAVVMDGRITVDVPAKDGMSFEIVLVPHRSQEDIERILARINRRIKDTVARAPEPDTLKKWIEEGRK